ncbi:hypothetical protein DOLIC_00084 [Dolichomitus sp. PSUC_FEM 10030005]|nr:hypothetical protein [Dolichomitus sp. PSUC_FEM 10030005]
MIEQETQPANDETAVINTTAEEDVMEDNTSDTDNDELYDMSLNSYSKYTEMCNYAMRLYDRQWKRQLKHRHIRLLYKKLRRYAFNLRNEHMILRKQLHRHLKQSR